MLFFPERDRTAVRPPNPTELEGKISCVGSHFVTASRHPERSEVLGVKRRVTSKTNCAFKRNWDL